GTYGRLASRRYSHRHTSERRSGHPEYVGVKVVCVNDVDLVLSQVAGKAPNLTGSMQIVKAVQPKLGNVVHSHSLHFFQQHALAIQRRDDHVAAAAFDQQLSQLHCLSLGSTLMETAD